MLVSCCVYLVIYFWCPINAYMHKPPIHTILSKQIRKEDRYECWLCWLLSNGSARLGWLGSVRQAARSYGKAGSPGPYFKPARPIQRPSVLRPRTRPSSLRHIQAALSRRQGRWPKLAGRRPYGQAGSCGHQSYCPQHAAKHAALSPTARQAALSPTARQVTLLRPGRRPWALHPGRKPSVLRPTAGPSALSPAAALRPGRQAPLPTARQAALSSTARESYSQAGGP